MSLLSERLIEQRNKMNWSRKRAASELQIPYSTYAGYEQGYREPDIETLKNIAAAYVTSIDYLVGQASTSNVKTAADISGLSLTYNGEAIDEKSAEEIRSFTRFKIAEHQSRYKAGKNQEVQISIFSDRLTKLREIHNFSKTKVAKLVGISLSRYANWEYGYNEPSLPMLAKLANALDTTTDYLTGRIDNPSPLKGNINVINLEASSFILDGKTVTGKTAEEVRNYARYLVQKNVKAVD